MRTARDSFRVKAKVVVLGLLVCAGATAGQRELRVCADPDNLPYSNEKREGFENKLVDLVAKDLHAKVKYTWVRQRRGLIRRTLKANACDVLPGLPTGLDDVLMTKPYYRSSYVFVYRKSDDLQLRSFDDAVLGKLKIGLHAIGQDGANPPPAYALTHRGLARNVVGFSMFGVEGVPNPQGKIIEAVANGDIDVAIVWGPFGGYFAKRQQKELNVVPVSPSVEPPGIPFTYEMSMGVRPGNTALKAELERVLERRRKEIRKILDDYGIPLVPLDTQAAPADAQAKK
jgi:quinoprotein dehydrogenase-associated probable ABC transporter substrate-binding protein